MASELMIAPNCDGGWFTSSQPPGDGRTGRRATSPEVGRPCRLHQRLPRLCQHGRIRASCTVESMDRRRQ